MFDFGDFSWWSLVLGGGYAGVLILLILHIILTKHEQADEATMWLLAVTLLPGFGIIAYLFFGITRFQHVRRRVRAMQQRALDAENEFFGEASLRQRRQLKVFLPKSEAAVEQQIRTFDRLFPTRPVLAGNRVEMLTDGVMAYPRMLEDMAAARYCIRLQSFILMSDEVGRQFLEVLRRKAAEGVDVKVIFDSFGSFRSYFSPFFLHCLRLRRPNFKIMAFSPVNIFAPWKFQLRNHRKLLLIDGRVAYTGGINISRDNTRLRAVPPRRYIHDLHCRITGPAVSQFTRSFFLDWAYTTRHRPEETAGDADFPPPEAAGETLIRVVDSGPGENYCGTQSLFFAAAALARHSLYLLTPYFVPGRAYLEALGIAAARGVEVRVIVPRRGNHRLVELAARSSYHTLLERGVRIFEKQGIFMHTKALLVDQEWGFMGSSNCDARSFRLNFERDFCFRGGDFPYQLYTQIRRELAESEEVTLAEVERKKFTQLFVEDVCSLLSPIL